VALRHPSLSVDLSGVGSCLFLLLVCLLLVLRELHSWLRRCRSYYDCRDGLKGQSVLRVRCVDDGVHRGHHIAPSGAGGPELLPVPDVAPSSLEDSSGVVHREGDPLWIIPTKMASESHPKGERLQWPKRLATNSRLPKWMVLPGVRLTPVGLLMLVMNESFSGTIETA
jgi:hypothetical protein